MIDQEQTNINIRIAALKDAAAITALLYDAFVEYKPLYTEKAFAATTVQQKEIEDRINNHAVWVALYDNKITGTVSIFSHQDEFFIRSMAVSPAARGKGVGKILMEHVNKLALSNGCTSIRLNTAAFLTQAIRLYESVGFRRNGVADLQGTSLIKMTKNLQLQKK